VAHVCVKENKKELCILWKIKTECILILNIKNEYKMKSNLKLSLSLLSATLTIGILSSFYKPHTSDLSPSSPTDDPIAYRAVNKQTTSNGAIFLATSFENDYYTPSHRIGHFYAEMQTEQLANNAYTRRLPMNISIVLDRSGSMSGDKIRNARQAAKYIIDQLGPDDYVSVVSYDQIVDVVYPAGRVENKMNIKSKIDRITDRGSTNLMGGAMKGFDEVKKNYRSGYINRVLLLSDGLANEGITNPTQIERIIRQKNTQDGISISTFGVGNDYNEDLMTAMAESGTGNYYFISQAGDIAGIFEKELNGLKNVVVQNAVLEIRLPEYVNVEKVYGFRYTQDGRVLRINFHDVMANETKGVLLRFKVDAGRNSLVRFDTRLLYTETTQHLPRSFTLSNKLEYTQNRDMYFDSFSEWVSAQVALFESNERMELATREVDKGNYQEARKLVKENKEYMQKKAPLVSKSAELQKVVTLTEEYDSKVENVESMPLEDVKYMQKATKSSNYQLRNKK
jgi:Ca-activated chloride channel family protein